MSDAVSPLAFGFGDGFVDLEEKKPNLERNEEAADDAASDGGRLAALKLLGGADKALAGSGSVGWGEVADDPRLHDMNPPRVVAVAGEEASESAMLLWEVDDEERCSSLGAEGGGGGAEVDDPFDCSRHNRNVDHPVLGCFFCSTGGSLSSISGSDGRGGKLNPWSSAEG